MYYAKKYNLQIGDQIVEPLFALGLSKHFAVYLGLENGIEWIAENHKVNGVQIIPAHTYFKKITSISRIDKFRGTNTQRLALIKNAKRLVGTPYNLVNYNCEHFATQITTGISESRQVSIAVTGLLAFIFIGLVNK